jgi:CheY-like chemotaxis protein
MEPLVVNGPIAEIERMLSRLLGEHINAIVDLEEDLWSIRGDAVSIDQIVTNLAINSRDAMPEGGVLAIETRNVVLDPEVRGKHPQARSGRFVRVAVRDTGLGMSEEIQAQMYDPFFTTKNPNENTGLGLSVVYGAVRAHGGWIEVTSAPGKGTRFDIYLPALAEEAPASFAGSPDLSVDENGRELILLLEDEGSLRDSVQKALERTGYCVESFGELETARSALSATPFDLILSDVRLPDGKGTTLVAEALERNKNTATILMSGYALTDDDPELAMLEDTPLLHKPFALADLLTEVRAQLDRLV